MEIMRLKISRMNVRSRKVIINSIISVSIKGLSIIIGFLTFPVYGKYFSNQSALGIWLTLLSVLAWIFTFDLGIGNGFRNHLTIALANGEDEEAKKYISSAYASVITLSILFSLIFVVFCNIVNLNRVFNISQKVIDAKTLKEVIILLFIGTMLQFSLKLITSIYMALQKAAIPSLLQVISNLLLFVYLILVKPSDLKQNFLNIALFYIVSINIPLLFANIIVFSKELRKYKPSISYIKVDHAKKIVRLGIIFLILQFMSLIMFSTNNYLITIFIDPKAVVEYQVYFKLFGLVSIFFTMSIIPLWSAVTDAVAKNDFIWIKKAYITLIKLLPLAVLGEVVIYFISGFLIKIWMGKEFISENSVFIISIAVSDFVTIVANIHAYISNGMGKLKNQLIYLSGGAIINIPLAYLISRYDKSASAIVISNILSLVPYIIMECVNYRKMFVRKVRYNEKNF